jgi:hydroxymethylbilane synthase/uroporphyrinogen III methyltransferase/synthase
MLRVIARDSLLSKAQDKEIRQQWGIDFEEIYIKTQGDLDLTTSLTLMESTDFFTREIDEAILEERADIAVHSAKDLPRALREGLELVALTEGVDSRDALVLKKGYSLQTLPLGAAIGTSSIRRQNHIKSLREDLTYLDIRGSVDRRLSLLETLPHLFGLIVAKAALIRLNIPGGITLDWPVAENQGKLALVCKKGKNVYSSFWS